ncbi:MAG: inositol monophosphatase [Coriobacteriia bacterium]|nr:inositol monophosphatase [Coriobacteriia bacterium]
MSGARQIAEAAARAGGDALRDHAGHVTGLRIKSGTADMVSEADIASGVAVVSTILERHTSARFVVEESEVYDLAGVERGSLEDPEVWVVDPLDGTTSFVHAYPCWSVSVALLRDGAPVAGAVYNVPADEMASAEAGNGAILDGLPLACSGSPALDGALLATGFPYDRGEPLDRQLRLLERLLRPAHDVRRDGSAAIDLVHVAAGRVDGFWETSLQPWDMAAGVLIVQESGGVATGFDGLPWSITTRDVVAANPRLHRVLLEAISEADSR